MNQVARVFVVINILLAAAFLMAAATFLHQTENWKEKSEQADKDKLAVEQRLGQQIAEQDNDIKNLQDDLNARKTKITQLEGDLNNARSEQGAAVEQKNQTERKFTSLNQTHGQLQSSFGAMKDSVSGLQDMIENYRKRAEAAQDAEREAINNRNTVVEERESLKQTKKNLEDSIKDLTEKLSAANTELGAYRGAYPPPANKSQPVIDGQVIRFDAATNMVQVNKGKNDGVRLGHRFDIVHGSDYVCTVMIDYVDSTTSVGHIAIPSTKGMMPTSGDKATKLSGM